MQPAPAAPAPTRTWKVGTLTYTSSGLFLLLIWLLLGDFVWAMRDRSIVPMTQWYLKHLEISNFLYSLILVTFPALLTLVLVPTISYKSDRYRGRLGRRIPFLLATTPIAAIGMIGIGICPLIGPMLHTALGQNSPGETALSLIAFTVFFGIFELGQAATEAVFGGLVNDVVPKEYIGRFYGMFRAVSLLDGIIFNALIFGHVETSFTLILCTIGLIYGIVFMWICTRIKEGSYPPPPQDGIERNIVHGFLHSAKTYTIECFTNKYYISVFFLLSLGVMTFMPVNTFNIPFARSLEVSMETYGRVIALSYLVSFLLSYFIGWMADKFHPLRMVMVSQLLYVGIMIYAYLFVRTQAGFLAILLVHTVSSGIYFTSSASLRQRLFPASRFAQFASAAGMLNTIAMMAVAPLIGMMIDWTGNLYNYAYAAGCLIAAASLLVALLVYLQFKKFGGINNYQAPE